MPRRRPDRPRRANGPDRGPSSAAWEGHGFARTEAGPDGESWQVRTVPGAQAAKTYRCPGCDHEIVPRVAHVVAWPSEEMGGADERRHWHTGCWAGRGRRGLTRRWS